MVDTAQDVVGMMLADELAGKINGAGIGFGFESYENIHLAGIFFLEPATLRHILFESVHQGGFIKSGLPFFNVHEVFRQGRHVLGNANPGIPLGDVDLNHLLQGVLGVAAKLAAVAAVNGYPLGVGHGISFIVKSCCTVIAIVVRVVMLRSGSE